MQRDVQRSVPSGAAAIATGVAAVVSVVVYVCLYAVPGWAEYFEETGTYLLRDVLALIGLLLISGVIYAYGCGAVLLFLRQPMGRKVLAVTSTVVLCLLGLAIGVGAIAVGE